MIRKWLASLNEDEYPLVESDGPDAFSRRLALVLFVVAYLCLLLMVWEVWDSLWYFYRDGSGPLHGMAFWMHQNDGLVRVMLGMVIGGVLISPWFLWGKWWWRSVAGMSLQVDYGWMFIMINAVLGALGLVLLGWWLNAWAIDVAGSMWLVDYGLGGIGQQLWLQLFGMPLLLMGIGVMNRQDWKDAVFGQDHHLRQRYRVSGVRAWVVIILVAILFGGMHAPNLWLVVLTCFGGGLWAWFLLRFGNGFAVLVHHALMGMAAMLCLGGGELMRLAIGWKLMDRLLEIGG